MVEKVIQAIYAIPLEDIPNEHNLFMMELHRRLCYGGFKFTHEHPIKFTSQLHRHSEKVKIVDSRPGRIDCMIRTPSGKTIALEYDNGSAIKYKSLEKLFQSGADVMIAVVKGSFHYDVWPKNLTRIKEVGKIDSLREKEFYFVIRVGTYRKICAEDLH